MGRKKERDVAPDLPRLTFDEAARVLGVTKAAFMEWLSAQPVGDDSIWKWTAGTRPLPEKLIRLYLTHQMEKAKREAAHNTPESDAPNSAAARTEASDRGARRTVQPGEGPPERKRAQRR